MKIILFFSLFFVNTCMAIDYTSFIERWEGRKHSQYVCPQGFMTIGVGHRILKHESFPEIMTDLEIDKLLEKDIQIAMNDARRIFKNFDKHPDIVKMIMVDLSFNLGYTRLSLFKKTISAFDIFDYKKASLELKDSRWYYQTGNRSKHHVEKLNSLR